MKKAILAFAVVSVSFVACNSGEDKKVEEVKTSDTTTVVTPKMDTATVVKDTTVKMTTTVDTLKK
jgi:hypothetical protein